MLACQTPLSSTISRSLLKPMCIESVMPSSHLILCCSLLLLPSVFPSIRVFSSELVLQIRWSKYWSFSTSPSHEYSELISFRIDWFDLLTVQGTLKNLLQHHRWKASILWCSAFLYGPTLTSVHDYWKNHSFDYMDLCWQVMSLLLKMLSRLIITFPKNKRLLISWLQSPSAVILEPKKVKSDTVSTVSPSISHEVMGLDAMILVF